jgi:hypothetical protein
MTLKLNGATSGSVSLDAPANTTGGADFTFKLPIADGSAGQILSTDGNGNLSWIDPIVEVDQWYLTADVTSDAVLTSWARNNFAGAATIGTGMSVTSGIWTFPSTGKWLSVVRPVLSIHDDDNVSINTYVTVNGGTSYSFVVYATDGNNGGGGNADGSTASFYVFDVTDTSQVKLRFDAGSIGTSTKVSGDTSRMETTVFFMKLGAT